MKNCSACGKYKDLDDFYFNKTHGAFFKECKLCVRGRVKKNRKSKAQYYANYDKVRYQKDPRVRARHKRYSDTEQGKASLIRAKHKWIQNNPEKRKAHTILNNAIRAGKIKKPSICQTCNKKKIRIEGHHEDYAQPLSVIWVCRSCHAKIHYGETS